MPDTPRGWRERAVDNLIQEASKNEQLARETQDRARQTPKLVVGSTGIQRPRKQLRSLAEHYRQSSDFYRHYAQVLGSRSL